MLDNKGGDRVVDELLDGIKIGSNLSVNSAYFTIFAYAELIKELSKMNGMRFLFTKPTFIKTID